MALHKMNRHTPRRSKPLLINALAHHAVEINIIELPGLRPAT